jgi:OmcA/MtrC family decaheme c-type cytochrome
LSSSIDEVVIADDGEITVTFTLTDESGVPLEPVLSSTNDEQQARVRFTVAHVEEYRGGGDLNRPFTRYVNDINALRPTYDRNGTIETVDAAAGLYRYVFAMRLAEGFDPSDTYSVGLQIDREFEGEELGVNPIFDVVPAGGTPEIIAGSTTEACNTCHGELILHGNRREFRLCTLCHTEGAEDEMGRSIALREMIHKIHRGRDLPSIVNGEVGATYGIFSSFQGSDIVFAEKIAEDTTVGVAFPRSLRDCDSCHTQGETAHFYTERPSAGACVACHDDVNPSLEASEAGPPGTNHIDGRGFPDGDCGFCHNPDSGVEFDLSVTGSHVVPERSMQLAGLNVEIVGVTNHMAGQAPTVSFRITNNEGAILTDLSGLGSLSFTLAGPTSDYAELIRASALGGGASGTISGPNNAGVFDYSLATSLPEDATGTWGVGIEARRSVQLATSTDETISVNEAAVNPVVTFTVDDSTALPRRVVVEDANCQNCHGELSRGFSIHGNLRNQVEYCVLCHNPNETDYDRRRRDPDAVAIGDENATIDLKVLIHKIHTGEELAQKPYLVYGFGSTGFTVHDFSEVLYPSDRRNCAMCHAEGTQLIPPFSSEALGTLLTSIDPATGDEVIDGRLGAITAACNSCHDSDAAMAHAATQTDFMGREACEVCHAEGRDVAVSESHAH